MLENGKYFRRKILVIFFTCSFVESVVSVVSNTSFSGANVYLL